MDEYIWRKRTLFRLPSLTSCVRTTLIMVALSTSLSALAAPEDNPVTGDVPTAVTSAPRLDAAYDPNRPIVRGGRLALAGVGFTALGVTTNVLWNGIVRDYHSTGATVLAISYLASYPLGVGLMVAGGVQALVTRRAQRRYDARGFEPQELSRVERQQLVFEDLEANRKVRRGTGLVIGGVAGLTGAGIITVLGWSTLSVCDGWGCVGAGVVAIGATGAGVLVALPSVASITVGAVNIAKGKRERRSAYHQTSGRWIAVVPTVLPGGAGMVLSGAF